MADVAQCRFFLHNLTTTDSDSTTCDNLLKYAIRLLEVSTVLEARCCKAPILHFSADCILNCALNAGFQHHVDLILTFVPF